MKSKENEKCDICKLRTKHPIAHFLDFHYRKLKLKEEKEDVLSYLVYLEGTPKNQREFGYEDELEKTKKRLIILEIKKWSMKLQLILRK